MRVKGERGLALLNTIGGAIDRMKAANTKEKAAGKRPFAVRQAHGPEQSRRAQIEPFDEPQVGSSLGAEWAEGKDWLKSLVLVSNLESCALSPAPFTYASFLWISLPSLRSAQSPPLRGGSPVSSRCRQRDGHFPSASWKPGFDSFVGRFEDLSKGHFWRGFRPYHRIPMGMNGIVLYFVTRSAGPCKASVPRRRIPFLPTHHRQRS